MDEAQCICILDKPEEKNEEKSTQLKLICIKRIDVGIHKLSQPFESLKKSPNQLLVVQSKSFIIENQVFGNHSAATDKLVKPTKEDIALAKKLGKELSIQIFNVSSVKNSSMIAVLYKKQSNYYVKIQQDPGLRVSTYLGYQRLPQIQQIAFMSNRYVFFKMMSEESKESIFKYFLFFE